MKDATAGRMRKQRPATAPEQRPAPPPERRHGVQAVHSDVPIDHVIRQINHEGEYSPRPAGGFVKSVVPWESADVVRAPEKRHSSSSQAHVISLTDASLSPSKLTTIVGSRVPEKRHAPFRTTTYPRCPDTAANRSHIFRRVSLRLGAMIDVHRVAFASALMRAEKMGGGLSKG